MGDEPSHPELLDYLASELIRRDWRLKDLHRAIVLSATYRTRSHHPEADDAWRSLLQADRDNRWLGRFPRRRLEAETLRDAMFAVSGWLNFAGGGPGVMPPLPEELKSTLLKGQWSTSPNEAEHYRRSVYLFARRNLPFPFFASFDRPSANASCARRNRSTTAPQALFLLNSELTRDAAERLAEAVRREHPGDRPAQVAAAFRRTLGRAPGAEQREAATGLLDRLEDNVQEGPDPLVELCRGLLNTNAFLYVD